jgi:uncharacterized protein YndB with AHSA1/START domain
MKMQIESPKGEPVIILRRTFDAPRALVWTAFTDPKHVVRWYGGHAFTSPVCTMDVRPGGRWRHTMRTPSGKDFELDLVFVEVVRPERLVWRNATHGGPPPPGQHNIVNAVTLTAAGPRTAWQLVSTFESIAERDLVLGGGYTRVIEEGSEKLNDLVITLATAEAT